MYSSVNRTPTDYFNSSEGIWMPFTVPNGCYVIAFKTFRNPLVVFAFYVTDSRKDFLEEEKKA